MFLILNFCKPVLSSFLISQSKVNPIIVLNKFPDNNYMKFHVVIRVEECSWNGMLEKFALVTSI
jgi:hypothetical protein